MQVETINQFGVRCSEVRVHSGRYSRNMLVSVLCVNLTQSDRITLVNRKDVDDVLAAPKLRLDDHLMLETLRTARIEGCLEMESMTTRMIALARSERVIGIGRVTAASDGDGAASGSASLFVPFVVSLRPVDEGVVDRTQLHTLSLWAISVL